MARDRRRKPTPIRTPEETLRLKDGLVRLAEGMIDDASKNFAILYVDLGGVWHLTCSDRTWGMGAALRMGIELDEGRPDQERDE